MSDGPVRDAAPSAVRSVSITSEPKQAAVVRAAVDAFAAELGANQSDRSNLVLAIDEAVCNVIKHGYRGQPGQPIDVKLERLSQKGRTGLRVVIRDQGRQIDPTEIVGRDLDDVRPGGLGTHIIRSIMDEVEYRRQETSGMELRMVKWLSGTRGASPAGGSAQRGISAS